MYPGREGDIAELARALPTVRDRFGRGLDRYKDGRFAVKVVTRDGAARIARFACELARRRKARGHAGKVTCVTKSNVLPQTDGLFHAIVKETVATYPDLAFEHFHVDDAARRIIRFPKTMDVVVCMNQYADILSDVAGEVAGGLGVAPSANFGDGRWAYFESVHGSAPDIAGRGIANPTGTLLSAALMLEHLGLAAEAERLQRSEEHTSELQSHSDLVCRLLLEKKKKKSEQPTQAIALEITKWWSALISKECIAEI